MEKQTNWLTEEVSLVLILIIMEDTHGGLMLGFKDGTKALS